MLSHPLLIGRIAAAAVLGGVIGYQRDRHGKMVGLRTHAMVALAAATFMIVSAEFVYYEHYQPGDPVRVDPSRIAAAVVSGIGFLAGGAILRNGLTIQGLTTAAGLWLVTAVGLAVGSGMWVEGLAATALGLVVLSLLRGIEARSIGSRRITVVTDDVGAVEDVRRAIAELGAKVIAEISQSSERREDGRRVETTFEVQIPDRVPVGRIVGAIQDVRAVERVEAATEN